MQLENLNASEVASRLNVTNAMVSRDLPSSTCRKPCKPRWPRRPAGIGGSTIARLDDDETRLFLAEQYGSGLHQDGVAKADQRQLQDEGTATNRNAWR